MINIHYLDLYYASRVFAATHKYCSAKSTYFSFWVTRFLPRLVAELPSYAFCIIFTSQKSIVVHKNTSSGNKARMQTHRTFSPVVSSSHDDHFLPHFPSSPWSSTEAAKFPLSSLNDHQFDLTAAENHLKSLLSSSRSLLLDLFSRGDDEKTAMMMKPNKDELTLHYTHDDDSLVYKAIATAETMYFD